jgi:ATP-binding cassette subfamily B (MDR/TAP) protein 1
MAISMTLGSLVVGFIYSWKLSLVLCSVLPFILITTFLMFQGLRSSSSRNQQAFQKAGGIAEECLKNIKTVTSFANYDYEINRFSSHLEVSYQAGLQGIFHSALNNGILFFLIFGSFTLAIWYGSYLISNEELNGNSGKTFQAGDVMCVLFTVIFGVFSLGQATPNFKAIFEAINAAHDFFELMERSPKIKISDDDEKPQPDKIKGIVRFENVVFSYPSKIDKLILDNLNLTFEQGKVTAIVGESGCGKSTIASLVERLYELQDENGTIFLDSMDISRINIYHLRSLIGYVPQEPVLLNTTIRENIKFGRDTSNITDDQIWEACRKAMADQFILRQPEGLDYIVGFRGSKLSGGEKQRIAIARAILCNPKILILDEATSALDNKNEKEVQLSLNRVSQGITTIVIAHRLSTIINSDKIVVLKKGKIVEEGNHQSLLEKNSHYFRLVNSQLGGIENESINESINEFKNEFKNEIISTNKENMHSDKNNFNSEQALQTERKETYGDEKPFVVLNGQEKFTNIYQRRRNSIEELQEQINIEKKKKLEFQKVANEKSNRIWSILKTRIFLVLSAAFCASFAGAIWPVYGLLQADSIDSLSKPLMSDVKEEGFMIAMYFLCLAVSAGLAYFLQE